MKIDDILAEGLAYPKLAYDAEAKKVLGSVVEWLEKIGINKENRVEVTKKALSDLTATATWKEAEKLGLTYSSSKRELQNGTLSLTSGVTVGDKYPKYSKGNQARYVYNIYGNGQIRQYAKWDDADTDKSGITRLNSPKPRVTADNPVRSLLLTWENALKEVNKKYKSKIKSIDNRK